ncbi:mitochondrial tricarboxylate transporter [Xylariales sp. PMI_506]|nr:mitochondrial tricarboxylate transporter [Xylariales sp. PMI_506]
MEEKSSVFTRIFAGGVAGASETIITYPAEFCKTRRQLQQSRIKAPQSSLQILRSTLQSDGIGGIYSGCRALAASNALKSGVRFFAFETARERFDKVFHTERGTGRSPWVNILSGLTAGIAEGVLVVTPGESLKTKIIHDAASGGQRFANRGLSGSAVLVFQQEGVRGLWSGLMPVLCKQGTNSAVRFTTFSIIKERVERTWPSMEGNISSTLLPGAASGVVTVYASMPFDNVKTRMQRVDSHYKGLIDCSVQLFRNDGVSAFWRGTSPRLFRLTLSSGITFTIYEQVCRIVGSISAHEMNTTEVI